MALTKIKRGGLDTGITDNSDANAITIDSSENVSFVSGATFNADIQINDAHPLIGFTDTDDNSDSRIYHSAGSLYIDADNNNEVGSSKIRFSVDDSEVLNMTTSTSTFEGAVQISHATTPDFTLNDTGGTTNKRVFRISGGGDAIYFEGRNNDNTGAGAIGGDGSIMSMSLTDASTTFAGDVTIPNKLIHEGNTNTYLQFETDVVNINAYSEVKLKYQDSSRLIARNGNVELYAPLVGTSATFAGDVTLSANTSILHLGSRFRMKSDHDNATGWFGVGSSLNNFKFGDADFGSAIAEINLSAGQAAFKVIKDTNAYAGYFENDNGQAQGIHIRCKSNDSGQTGRYLIKAQGYGSSGAFTDNFLLDIDGNATFNGNIVIPQGNVFYLDGKGSSADTYLENYQTDRVQLKAGGYGYQFYNGDADAVSGNWIDSSDERVKKNVSDLTGSLDKVNKLRPVSFKWKKSHRKDERAEVGFIGQEIAKEIPEVVRINDTSSTGGYEDFHSVAYSKLVAHLVGAVQELSAKVEALENK